MVETGYLSHEQAEEAKKIDIKFADSRINIKAPYFTLWVKQQLEQEYGAQYLQRGGLNVYTSLDWDLQMLAEKEVADGVKRNYAYYAHNAALTAINPKSGEVLAMTVGSGNYYDDPYPKDCKPGVDCLFDPQYNVAVADPGRQPGSAFNRLYMRRLLKMATATPRLLLTNRHVSVNREERTIVRKILTAASAVQLLCAKHWVLH